MITERILDQTQVQSAPHELPAIMHARSLASIGLLITVCVFSGSTSATASGIPVSEEAQTRSGLKQIDGRFALMPVDKAAAIELISELHAPPETVVTELSVGILEASTTRSDVRGLIQRLRRDERLHWVEPVYQGRDGKPLWLTGTVLVRLHKGRERETLAEVTNRLQARFGNDLPFENALRIELPRDRSYDAIHAVAQIAQNPNVRWAEPSYFFRGLASQDPPNDMYFKDQWAHKNEGYNIGDIAGEHGIADVDLDSFEPADTLDDAWDITRGDTITVAIIDTGVEVDHEDLEANIVPGINYYPSCEFCKKNLPPGFGGLYAHGTNAAGVVAAIQDNEVGVSGVSPNVKIMQIRVGCGREVSNTSIQQGIIWAAQNGADILSMSLSWSSEYHQGVLDAIRLARSEGRNGKGSVVVAATGNHWETTDPTTVGFPANEPETIAVGAHGPCGCVVRQNIQCAALDNNPPNKQCIEPVWGENHGPELDLVAPGVQIYTTDLTDIVISEDEVRQCGAASGSYHGGFLGTSAATAFVSGIGALILSIDPALPPDGVRGFMADTTEEVMIWDETWSAWLNPWGATRTWHEQAGWGRVNAYQALVAVLARNKMLVHANAGNTPDPATPAKVIETGTSQEKGFNTLAEGIQAVEENGELVLGAGDYTATTLDKPMTLSVVPGETATITKTPDPPAA